MCLVYSKKDFLYHGTDAPDTKKRMQDNYAVLKEICDPPKIVK